MWVVGQFVKLNDNDRDFDWIVKNLRDIVELLSFNHSMIHESNTNKLVDQYSWQDRQQ